MSNTASGLTVACTPLIFVIMLVAQAAVGYKYLNDCPTQPFIPIYLLVMGGGILIFCFKKWCSILIILFFFGWFIAGNVSIFAIYKPSFRPYDGKDYCDMTLYFFAFGSTIFTHVLLGVVFFCWCCEKQEAGHNVDV